MTPSASASPIVLLASPAAPAAPAATGTTNAENGLNPVLEGGFQLLIDAAAQQQQVGQPGGTAVQTPMAPTPEGSDAPADVGNVLPLAGLMLPVDGEQPPVAEGDGTKTETSAPDDDTDPVAAAPIALPWVPVNIQQAPAPAANTAPSTRKTGDATQAAAALAAAGTGVQLTAPGSTAATTDPAADAVAKTATTAIDGVQLGAGNPASAAPEPQRRADATTRPAAELLTGVQAGDDAKAAVAAEGAGAGKAGDIASFADLLKPAANAQSQAAGGAQPGAQVTALDGGRVHQATRPYLDVGNSAATSTVSIPVGGAGWSDAVVDKVMWFSANQLSSAEIKLNPPDLGPLQVRISTQQDQTSVVFSSPHAAVRDALDQALPRLRDMFGGQGLQLTDASVGGQAQRQQQQQQGSGNTQQGSNVWFGSEDNGDTPVAVTRVVGPRLSTSAVDAYA